MSDIQIAGNASPRRMSSELGLLPGLALTASLTGASYALRLAPGLDAVSPMILAIVLGAIAHNLVGVPESARAGIAFTMRRILRLGIILLGFQLTAQQLVEVGGRGVAIIVATLAVTFLVTKLLGRLLGVERRLAELIAAGTSICGASAVIATNTVTKGSDEDVAYAVACVTVFGSASMLLYPTLPVLLHLGPHGFGLWAGASIHEIAQVVATSFQDGTEAGHFGTIAKLARVLMLAPLVIALGLAAARKTRNSAGAGPQPGRAKAPLPLFVLGFLAVVAINSLGIVPHAAKPTLVTATAFLLAMSLAAMGLEMNLRKLRAKGLRPLALGFFSWVFISGFSLALIELLY